ncbi:calcyphosin-like protein [Ruditapes philippinarum]|uniref:calcyphosin-like protein n=1 Tax=Ruditapes philippinarum TaxID=129788 RepID=UPI00295B2051|nr:calcyphosin-like protein [Ruditapes philippinarum]
MTSTNEEETQLKEKCSEKLKTCEDALEMLRLKCLERGAKGIRGLARVFRIMDDDSNKQLSLDEFRKGLTGYGLMIDEEITKKLFEQLDKDKSGSLDFDEFLQALRDVSSARYEIINKAFEIADINGDGVIDCKDLSEVFNANDHPNVVSGEWNVPQVYKTFLDQFDTNDDGEISKEEFTNYYAGVSASIDDDAYFELMMKNAWKMT